MPAKERYRAGAIGRTGAGGYGHNLHLAYEGVDGVDFVALADPDEEGREKAAAETGAQQTYADYREMLEKESLDIVSVCPRWLDCHEEMVVACAEAGCHIYCEKPIAASLDVADRMVGAVEAAGVRLAVAHQGVYLPQVQAVRRMVEEGRIGPVQAVFARGKQDHRGGGEDMIVLGTHTFNMMRYFLGDAAWMWAHVTAGGRGIGPGDVREPAEPVGLVAGDSVNSYIAFRNGTAGYFVSRADQPGGGKGWGMEVVGRDGRIWIRGGAGEAFAIYPHGPWTPEDPAHRWEPLEIESAPFKEGNRLAIVDLIEAIEQDRDPISSGRDAAAALEMILGAYESEMTGCRVAFPMSERSHPLERLRSKEVGQ